MKPKAAVVGCPVSHSLSPRIFAEFSKSLKRPIDYGALELTPEGLEPAFREAQSGGWVGWNVTLPYKLDVLELVDKVDALAKEVGAVNAVHFAGKKAMGYNTDVSGFLAPLKAAGFALKGKRVAVLGAGGAARAVCAAAAREGAELWVLNRTLSKGKELAKAFKGKAAPLDATAEEVLAKAALVVNATSAGMDGKTSPLPEGIVLTKEIVAYDLLYRPLRTPFLKAAEECGARAIGGLAMLVAQAAATWRLWFEEEVPPALSAAVEWNLSKEI